MGKLKIKFNPIYVIFLFFCIYFGYFKEIVWYTLVLILHEFAHVIVGKLLGYNFGDVKLNLYGASVETKNKFVEKDEIIISLAGPIFNIVFALILVGLWWAFPNTYDSTLVLFQANVAMVIFNLLPMFPLDAGRVVFISLKNKYSKKIARVILRVITIIFILVFSVLLIISIFDKINLNYLFIICFLLMSLNSKDLGASVLDFIEKDNKNVMEIKSFFIKEENVSKLLSYCSSSYYSQFYILNNEGKVVKKIGEKELVKNFLNMKY